MLDIGGGGPVRRVPLMDLCEAKGGATSASGREAHISEGPADAKTEVSMKWRTGPNRRIQPKVIIGARKGAGRIDLTERGVARASGATHLL